MDQQLLLLLFVLFGVILALLKKRKRKRAAEDARSKVPAESWEDRVEEDLEEEEEVGGWPFPMGGDPVEPRPKRQPPRQTPAPAPDETADGEADSQAREVVERAREAATQAQRIQPKQRVEALVQKRLAAVPEERVVEGVKRRRRWTLTPDKAKEAIVYAEILGPPKAERREEFP